MKRTTSNKTKKTDQEPLFEVPANWEKEWQNMPDFLQKDLTPYKSVIVHFKSEEDIRTFEEAVDHPISPRTKFIWFPRRRKETLLNKKCVDDDS